MDCEKTELIIKKATKLYNEWILIMKREGLIMDNVNATPIPSNDSHSPLEQKAKNLRRQWFGNLPIHESDKIIEKEFNNLYPTNEKKKQALEGLN